MDSLCDCYLCRELSDPYLDENRKKMIIEHRWEKIREREYIQENPRHDHERSSGGLSNWEENYKSNIWR